MRIRTTCLVRSSSTVLVGNVVVVLVKVVKVSDSVIISVMSKDAVLNGKQRNDRQRLTRKWS